MKGGESAPDFELKSHTGETVRLSSYFGKKKVVLFFYVKDNTPGCAAEVNGFKNYYHKVSDKYEILGINQDSEDSHMKFCSEYKLPFKLLSDPGKKIASLYDARGTLGMYTKRITYLIGLDGKIERIIAGIGASKHIEFIESLASP
ncbi:MAG: peroxiredoxin [Thaumarchaeota archaeon]|nr:MAG: peroxiredoxin [Nitrososphaerota archaeon]